MLDTEAIPLNLLGADKKKAVLLLQEHTLVTVDDTGCAAMHAVTQLVVRDFFTPKVQRPLLVAAMAFVLESKLCKFHQEKPATFFIGRRDTLAQWQHMHANGASCRWPRPAVLGAAVALALGRVSEVQTVLCSTILGSCAHKQGSSLT